MTGAFDEREARKEYVRHRQTIVFSIVATVLVVALIIATLFYTHILGRAASTSPAAQPNYGVQVPCAPKDQDGNASKYADNASVSVRLLNGTKFTGFAKAVGDALANRNFKVTAIQTYNRQNVERTTIYFGKGAIPQAYTVGANFTDAILKMDDRQDNLIDVVLGATFNDLKTQKKVPVAGGNITSIAGCVPADKMTKLPQAIQHDPAQ
ncbi:LytR C-terminal domain-containing protein [Bifidobacterium tibiigranuli]|jgi:hypothetical protein|uniref:LytR C-terminal domain-containing protein n=1 Tax=Bifidobacterium tibiigranuli TaxID=2172043 RepID=UPI0026EDD148|nr:LytR C-terminal domain-containing protein [Bifidobacterium tibiigranuli]MCI1649077.1 LytR C-terminal domain-containing protein [Bifidobacterium tibiigranuli]MCI1673245.1 LytR C-terminal domain-containing protein [Bifidobacterium tibiigranuli]MCI1713510.1 LytR C-terminal domain-containing protein [Bifidobacterium tibiigranuli]MCI1834210.1 LytR C-terminal domain-containing protein [Bifidobacterium tibiigranuli]MCI2186312.1 LytR C-terminal domain-containing protein [Bifidobacterium tibiigranul